GERRRYPCAGGLHGLGLRQRTEHADWHRLPWQQEQFPGFCARIGSWLAEPLQRTGIVWERRIQSGEPINASHPCVRPHWSKDRRTAWQAYSTRRRIAASRAGDRHRLRARFPGRPTLRDRLESSNPRRWAEQQFAHRDRGPAIGNSDPVYQRLADGGPSDRAARVQRWLYLLVARLDHQ